MKKVKIIIVILLLIILSIFIYKYYNYLRIKNAKIEVVLKDDLNLEFNDKKRVSNFIKSINGKIINDYIIDSHKLGEKKIDFEFINDDNIKVKYSYNINVVDTVAPVIWVSNSYSVSVGSDKSFFDNILCGDNYDSKPNCYIEGEYDLNKEGNYLVDFVAVDSSGNEKKENINLKVYEPKENNNESSSDLKVTNFSDVISKYKNNKNKIGIDVSSWQGEIDFDKLSKTGVEFIIIRIGGQKGTNKEYFLDDQFKRNIKLANKYNIDVGLYFFSYATNKKQAIKDANYVLKNIKGYKIDLPITYDWEDFSDFNTYNLSFYELTSMSNAFTKKIEEKGYKAMHYSSKNYLNKIWLDIDSDIWLAHYTDQTDYEGEYKIWQMCDNGKIDGINGMVDIDILIK